MIFNRRKQRLPLQLMALFCLLVWIASIAVCVSDCASGQKQHDCCHKKSSGSPQDKPLRLHSQTIASAPLSVQISKPDFGIRPILISRFQNLSSQLESKTDSFRQPVRSQFVFTPEVWLGPAFRSLVPPASA
jgi:hypothetical protein